MAKDPVRGMNTDEKKAAGKSEYQGQSLIPLFPGCKPAFDKEPHKDAGKK